LFTGLEKPFAGTFCIALLSKGADLNPKAICACHRLSLGRFGLLGAGCSHNYHVNWCDSIHVKPDPARRSERKIDDTTSNEWAAVVDANSDRSPIIETGYPDQGPKGQGSVGCGQGVHVIYFAGGGAPPVVGLAIPRGKSALCRTRLRLGTDRPTMGAAIEQ
jgi:hypothetical protein